MAEKLVRERIRLLKEAWKDPANYACECPPGSQQKAYGRYNLACCRSFEDEPGFNATEPCTCLDGETEALACCVNNFMPESLGGVLFDEVPAEDVVAEIMRRIPPYITRIMTTAEGNIAFKRYNDKEKVSRWNWIEAGVAESAVKASGLFSTTDPIMRYDASEAGYPFRKGVTLWQMCAGLLGQVRAFALFPLQGKAGLGHLPCSVQPRLPFSPPSSSSSPSAAEEVSWSGPCHPKHS